MKFLNSKRQINQWLKEHGVENYTIHEQKGNQYPFVVNVNGDVSLQEKGLDNIPIKFYAIIGMFDCSYNQLTDLEFCPSVIGGLFDCSYNKLQNLEFFPSHVSGMVKLHNNPLLDSLQTVFNFERLKKEHLNFLEIKKINDSLISQLPEKDGNIKIKI